MQRDDRLDGLPPVPAGAQEEEAPQQQEQPEEQPKAAPARRARRTAASSDSASSQSGTPRRRSRQAASAEETPAEKPATGSDAYVPRLRTSYNETVVSTLMQEFSYQNVMQVPQVKKVVLNIGAGEAQDNARVLEGIQRDLATIAGQKPVVTRARLSIAGFKIREGNTIGASVTLRGDRMWDFLDRLMNIALPRTRDFRGVSLRGFDGRGNYSMGVHEQIIFPEIDYNRIDQIRGFQVTIVTSAGTNDEGHRLLDLLGMPFVRQEGE